MSYASPTASVSSPLSKYKNAAGQPVTSPYLSESAHVLSLQHPVGLLLSEASSGGVSPSSNKTVGQSPDAGTSTGPKAKAVSALSPDSASHASSIRSRKSRRSDYFKEQNEIDSGTKPTDHSVVRRTTLLESWSITSNYSTKQTGTSDHEDTKENRHRSNTHLPWISAWSHGLGKTGTWLKEEIVHSKLSHRIFGRAPSHRKHARHSLCSISVSSRRGSKNTPKSVPRMFHGNNSELQYSTSYQYCLCTNLTNPKTVPGPPIAISPEG